MNIIKINTIIFLSIFIIPDALAREEQNQHDEQSSRSTQLYNISVPTKITLRKKSGEIITITDQKAFILDSRMNRFATFQQGFNAGAHAIFKDLASAHFEIIHEDDLTEMKNEQQNKKTQAFLFGAIIATSMTAIIFLLKNKAT